MKCSSRLRKWYASRFARMYQCTILLRPQSQILYPLVIPRGLERTRSHFGNRPCCVWSTKRAEAFLCLRFDIWITGVCRCTSARQNKKGNEVSLVKNVHMRISSKVSTITVVPEGGIKRQVAPGVAAVLY